MYTDIIMILYAHITLYAIRVLYSIMYVIYTHTPTECETNDHVNRFRSGGEDDDEDGIDIVVLLLLLYYYYCYMTCSLFYRAEREER